MFVLGSEYKNIRNPFSRITTKWENNVEKWGHKWMNVWDEEDDDDDWYQWNEWMKMVKEEKWNWIWINCFVTNSRIINTEFQFKINFFLFTEYKILELNDRYY